MLRIIFVVLLTATSYQIMNAKPANDADRIKVLEDKCSLLQNEQANMENHLSRLTAKQKENVHRLQSLDDESVKQRGMIDSMQIICRQLANTLSADRKEISGKIRKTNNNVQANQEMLQSRTMWMGIMAVVLLIIIIGISYRLAKSINSGDISIGEVRKAQEAFRKSQTKMQEEYVKLDDKMLELFDRQMSAKPKEVGTDKPDHSLALKVADEIVRIELNMSRMDSSIKGYKQLAKAVERIKDNFKANGYEIIDMLGLPYNEGMKVTANFVADEELEEGKQIITGITKPQINYNGQMIQAAQITVSQNI